MTSTRETRGLDIGLLAAARRGDFDAVARLCAHYREPLIGLAVAGRAPDPERVAETAVTRALLIVDPDTPPPIDTFERQLFTEARAASDRPVTVAPDLVDGGHPTLDLGTVEFLARPPVSDVLARSAQARSDAPPVDSAALDAGVPAFPVPEPRSASSHPPATVRSSPFRPSLVPPSDLAPSSPPTALPIGVGATVVDAGPTPLESYRPGEAVAFVHPFDPIGAHCSTDTLGRRAGAVSSQRPAGGNERPVGRPSLMIDVHTAPTRSIGIVSPRPSPPPTSRWKRRSVLIVTLSLAGCGLALAAALVVTGRVPQLAAESSHARSIGTSIVDASAGTGRSAAATSGSARGSVAGVGGTLGATIVASPTTARSTTMFVSGEGDGAGTGPTGAITTDATSDASPIPPPTRPGPAEGAVSVPTGAASTVPPVTSVPSGTVGRDASDPTTVTASTST